MTGAICDVATNSYAATRCHIQSVSLVLVRRSPMSGETSLNMQLYAAGLTCYSSAIRLKSSVCGKVLDWRTVSSNCDGREITKAACVRQQSQEMWIVQEGKLFTAHSQKPVRAMVMESETLREVATKRLQCQARSCRVVVRNNFAWVKGHKSTA